MRRARIAGFEDDQRVVDLIAPQAARTSRQGQSG
jgi:hypothetical protein